MSAVRVAAFGIMAATAAGLWACAPQQRMGMVVDPATGLQYGSIIERNIVIDPSQFKNRKVKVNIRNTSGDLNFDLQAFREKLEQAYAAKGYEPVRGDDFAILLDANVVYSGQVTSNMSKEFAFLGGAAGGIAGNRSSTEAGTAIGVVSGITLGAIIGSYVTDDTYIVVAYASLALVDPELHKRKTTIVFSDSNKEQREERSNIVPFRESLQTGIAVYAGGRNTSQARIADQVRQRFVRILSDVI